MPESLQWWFIKDLACPAMLAKDPKIPWDYFLDNKVTGKECSDKRYSILSDIVDLVDVCSLPLLMRSFGYPLAARKISIFAASQRHRYRSYAVWETDYKVWMTYNCKDGMSWRWGKSGYPWLCKCIEVAMRLAWGFMQISRKGIERVNLVWFADDDFQFLSVCQQSIAAG